MCHPEEIWKWNYFTDLESDGVQPDDVLGLHRDLVQFQRQLVLQLMPQNPAPPVSPAPDPASAHSTRSAGAAAAANDLGGHDEILGEVQVLRRGITESHGSVRISDVYSS